MAKDIGEEIVGAWLREVAECDFVQYNVPTRKNQGEIDVVGLNLEQKKVYICEVATHIQGLQYTKNSQPNNYEKLAQKFASDVIYGETYLKQFERHYMLWSPIVPHPKTMTTRHNTFRDLARVQHEIQQRYSANIEMVINESYWEKVKALKNRASRETFVSQYPVFRLLQIFEVLEQHVTKLKNAGITNSQVTIDTYKE